MRLPKSGMNFLTLLRISLSEEETAFFRLIGLTSIYSTTWCAKLCTSEVAGRMNESNDSHHPGKQICSHLESTSHTSHSQTPSGVTYPSLVSFTLFCESQNGRFQAREDLGIQISRF
jgi:hypothetical protein